MTTEPHHCENCDVWREIEALWKSGKPAIATLRMIDLAKQVQGCLLARDVFVLGHGWIVKNTEAIVEEFGREISAQRRAEYRERLREHLKKLAEEEV